MLEIAPRDTLAFILSVAGATAITFILYRRTSPTLPLRMRLVLGVIRWFAAMIVLLLVADPVARIVRTEYRDPVIAVLVDNSRSMDYPDAESKLEKAREVLTPDLIGRLESKGAVRFYFFSDRSFEVTREQTESFSPEGSRTDLAEGIRTVLDEADVAPSAMVVVSDGAVNFGEDVMSVVSTLRSPLYSVAVTPGGITPDVSLDKIEATETAYAGTDVPLSLVVSARGTGPVDVAVAVKDSTGTVLSRRVSLPGTGAKTRVDTDIGAGGIGIHDFKVELSGLDGEAVTANNAGVFSIEVIKGKIRVLLIARGLSWDFAFARRSLEADPNIEVLSLFTDEPARSPSIEGSVSGYSSLSGLDAVIVFGDALRGDLASGVREAVRDGMGAVLLAEREAAGMDNDLSPFDVSGDKGPAGSLVSVSATNVGTEHEILMLAQAAAGFSWSELPPVRMSGGITGARSDATVLLTGRGDRGELPILAIRRYGRGRVVGLAAYDLWRWDLIPKGFGLDASPYAQVLLNSIGWLTEAGEVSRLALSVSKRAYLWGEPVDLFARVVDEDLKPVEGAVLEGEVTDQATGEVVRRFSLTEKGSGSQMGRIDHLSPGKYRARVTARLETSPYAGDAVDFIVDTRGLEDFGFDGDPALLRQVSRLTGGGFFEAGEADRLPDEVNPGAVVVETHKDLNLPLSLPVFVILATLLGLEWLLRKRRMLL
jgi:hypothetical protein